MAINRTAWSEERRGAASKTVSASVNTTYFTKNRACLEQGCFKMGSSDVMGGMVVRILGLAQPPQWQHVKT